jgi:hypothetical protein
MAVLWDVTPSVLYKVLGVSKEPTAPKLLLRRYKQHPTKRWFLSTKPHGVTSQKTVIFIFTTERNLMQRILELNPSLCCENRVSCFQNNIVVVVIIP